MTEISLDEFFSVENQIQMYIKRYPNKEIPPYPWRAMGDMIPELRECECGKLFWTLEFSRKKCGEC